jgi:ankyrin repeat protein
MGMTFLDFYCLFVADGEDHLDSMDNHGRTPLSFAAESDNALAVDYLLANDKVSANSNDDKGRTPLFYAAKKGYQVQCLSLLNFMDLESMF